MRRRRKRRGDGGKAAIAGAALIVLAALVLGGLGAFYYFAPRSPELDKKSLCPVTGPEGIRIVLVDATDDLPEVAKRQVLQILNDEITSLPAFFRLDIRVLDVQSSRSRSVFAKCNPGNGTGLSEWTENPRLARLQWIERFRKPAREAIEISLEAAKAQNSPIMAALQDIAVDQLSSAQAQRAQKKLIVISDMLELTRDYSQYPRAGDLSYERFRRSPAYMKFRTDLHGAEMRVEYVQRASISTQFASDHMTFWQQWTRDNGGSKFSVRRLQGVN